MITTATNPQAFVKVALDGCAFVTDALAESAANSRHDWLVGKAFSFADKEAASWPMMIPARSRSVRLVQMVATWTSCCHRPNLITAGDDLVRMAAPGEVISS